ncbi:dimethylallyltransferase [Streptomyces sulfonofaciens]|uniref:Dimethylallyltransferase n=1 Tax=Streptomyces sulfonofaciens TaxID=68272 RepID=A0A919GFQ2_9ACTN|nr:polyprenyl synthetase family protein [Streptomyces sulfonofaciens]GHH83569.1 dimethylallyltransferase [Streptomyces sulfonofaciens]
MTALSAAERPAAAPDGTGAAEILRRCRESVRPALTAAIGRLHPWPGEMASYSLGWCEVGGAPSVDGGGKGLREALAVLCARAAGARERTGVASAVAVELIHTFTLLHDDIMDGDHTRRRRPAVWKAYGTGPAVLAGDALFALAVETLADAPGPHGPAAVRCLSAALNDLVRGQADDLLFATRPWTGPGAVALDEYRAMAEHKTGALLGCAAALGAVLGGAPREVSDALGRAGRHLGIAFQAVDDLLGIWGDPAVTGKPVHSDLRSGKKTFPVLAALGAAPSGPRGPAAGRLAALLDAGPSEDCAVRRAASLIEEAGGRSATLEEADRHLARAHSCLDTLPSGPAVSELRTLLASVARRVR